MQRTEGFYWVRFPDGEFEIAAWTSEAWSITASRAEFNDDDFEWIGERIPEPTGDAA